MTFAMNRQQTPLDKSRVTAGKRRSEHAVQSLIALIWLSPWLLGATSLPSEGLTLPTKWNAEMGLFVVEARIDGKGPFHLVLDTGASMSALDISARTNWEAGSYTSTVLLDATSRRLKSDVIQAEHVNLGSWKSGPAKVAFVDFAMVRRAIGNRFQGVAGLSLFTNAQLSLDYPEKKVSLFPSETPRPEEAREMPFEWRLGVAVAPLEVGRETFPVEIDSGFVGRMTLPVTWKTKFESRPRVVRWVVTAGGRSPEKAGRLKQDIVWGGLRFSKPIVAIKKKDHGIIGIEVLKQFRVIFNGPDRKLWLLPAVAGPVESEPFETYGLASSYQEDGILVEGLIPGTSAARSRIRSGDIITQVNGKTASSLGRKQLNDITGPLELDLRRGKKTWHEKLKKTVLIP